MNIIDMGIIGFLLTMVMVIGGIIFWVWTLIDCATKEPSQGNDKIIWILVIVFTGWIGSLIYLFVRRPQRIEQFGQ